jgi:hypothetical protein
MHSIGLDDCIKSVKVLGRSYKPFLQTLEALQPVLAWFPAVAADPSAFAILAFSYLAMQTDTFPSLTNGTYPATIQDQRGFSPLQDMCYGLT